MKKNFLFLIEKYKLILIKKYYKIKFSDRCLLIFMAILMLQTVNSVFFHSEVDSAQIDVVIRSSAVSIFGYFISSNFAHPPKAEIGGPGEEPTKERRGQISFATTIGIISLIVIITARNFGFLQNMIFLAQLRDFVSGSIGFLLGYPTNKNKINN